VHEAYTIDEIVHGHVRIVDLLAMAREEGVRRLALTHIRRDIRRSRLSEIRRMAEAGGVDVLIPEPGNVVEIE
jgi:ribonuclease BN (tRNA processing enzyme)